MTTVAQPGASEPTSAVVSKEQLRAMEGDGIRRELLRGRVFERAPTGGPHGTVVRRLFRTIDDFAVKNGIGQVWHGKPGFLIARNPDTVAKPNLALVPASYVSRVSMGGEGYHELVPSLIVEVKSPAVDELTLYRRLAAYLYADVSEVWMVRPSQGTIFRHWPEREPEQLWPDQVICDIEALPGFSMTVGDVFPST